MEVSMANVAQMTSAEGGGGRRGHPSSKAIVLKDVVCFYGRTWTYLEAALRISSYGQMLLAVTAPGLYIYIKTL